LQKEFSENVLSLVQLYMHAVIVSKIVNKIVNKMINKMMNKTTKFDQYLNDNVVFIWNYNVN